MPPVVRDGIRVAFSDALHVVFLAAVPVAIIGFLLSLFLREVPLRSTTGRDQGPTGGMPTTPEVVESEQSDREASSHATTGS